MTGEPKFLDFSVGLLFLTELLSDWRERAINRPTQAIESPKTQATKIPVDLFIAMT